MLDLLRQQLIAARAQIDATLTALESFAEVQEPAAPQSCTHPEAPENVGTFGAPEWRCPICHTQVSAPAET